MEKIFASRCPGNDKPHAEPEFILPPAGEERVWRGAGSSRYAHVKSIPARLPKNFTAGEIGLKSPQVPENRQNAITAPGSDSRHQLPLTKLKVEPVSQTLGSLPTDMSKS